MGRRNQYLNLKDNEIRAICKYICMNVSISLTVKIQPAPKPEVYLDYSRWPIEKVKSRPPLVVNISMCGIEKVKSSPPLVVNMSKLRHIEKNRESPNCPGRKISPSAHAPLRKPALYQCPKEIVQSALYRRNSSCTP